MFCHQHPRSQLHIKPSLLYFFFCLLELCDFMYLFSTHCNLLDQPALYFHLQSRLKGCKFLYEQSSKGPLNMWRSSKVPLICGDKLSSGHNWLNLGDFVAERGFYFCASEHHFLMDIMISISLPHYET